MKPKNLLIVLLILFSCKEICAQNNFFLTQGKIEFEKKFNLWAQIENFHENAEWTELRKKMMPKFKTTYFDLIFSGNKTLYKPGKENPENNRLREDPAEENKVYSDLDKASRISEKKVFGEFFLVQDSTRQIHWKITDEMRSIAGFPCRRANAIIMDSIYVVAFYTEDIVTPGGPESFNGLPGIILGIALPHQHITWFATKVQNIEVSSLDLIPPVKGKKMNGRALREILFASFKDDGDWAQVYQQEIEY